MQTQLTRPQLPSVSTERRSPRQSDTNEETVRHRNGIIARFGYCLISLSMIAAVHWCDAHKQTIDYARIVGLVCVLAIVMYLVLTVYLVASWRQIRNTNRRVLEGMPVAFLLNNIEAVAT